MKKITVKIILLSIIVFTSLFLNGCMRHTHYWTVEVEVYNSTLKNAYLTVNGETRLVPARSWESWTVECEDSEVYCDLFEDYRFRDELFWDSVFIDHSGNGSGYNIVYEDDYCVQYKLYYNNTTNIIYVDRVF